MAVGLSAPVYHNDPDYVAAMAAFHHGQWSRAIPLLESLAARYPHAGSLQTVLDEARLKAHLDATANVQAKRWAVDWRPWAARVLIVVALLTIVWAGALVVRQGFGPMLRDAAARQTQARLLAQGQQALADEDWDGAESAFRELLALAPAHAQALAGLTLVAEERSLLALYEEAIAAIQAGDLATALQLLSELQTRRPNYSDVSQQVTRVRRYQEIDGLLAEAGQVRALQLHSLALDRYQQARSLDLTYRRQEVVDGLVSVYLLLADEIVNADPPAPHRLPEAVTHFDAVLTLDTRNPVALEERRLARLYLEGRQFATQGNYHFAVSRFQSIYDVRPDYQGDIVYQLYDGYIGSGDQYNAAGDCSAAYGQYAKAGRLPVEDTTVALARMSQTVACLTPTPTPSNTPPPTAPPPPSATPSPTPTPRPLNLFRGKIVFKSDHPEQPGIWVVNPDGTGREYLGALRDYEHQLRALRDAEMKSPDGLLRLFVSQLDGREQVWVDFSQHPQFQSIGSRALTRLSAISYDPVWSPDGGTIAFVTQENGSDDIWLMDADGNRQRSIIRNDWEWDKHPSWSPDSTLLVFFSNRNGLRHLYIMDTNGRVLRNLTNNDWEEYDPIWIK